ncbi:MAG: rod shape-determining protein MreC [Burkholderiales bacterium]
MEYQPPPFFKRGPSPLARFTFFALLSIALLFADARLRYLEHIREAVSVALYPLERAARAPGSALARFLDYFTAQSELIEENEALRLQTLRLSAQAARLEALISETNQLRKMLSASERSDLNLQLGEIVYSKRDPFTRKVVVDKGSQQGARPGQAVIDEHGLVGQVTRVLPLASEVTLITDKNQAVPVQNLRTGARAVLFGVGRDDTLDLRFMPVNADIQSGDTLVTSGIDGLYPAGFPVATVAAIDRSATNAFARIDCAPVAGVNRGSLVMLVLEKRAMPEKPADETPTAKPIRPRKGAP